MELDGALSVSIVSHIVPCRVPKHTITLPGSEGGTSEKGVSEVGLRGMRVPIYDSVVLLLVTLSVTFFLSLASLVCYHPLASALP